MDSIGRQRAARETLLDAVLAQASGLSRELRVFAEVDTDDDVLPVRARYGETDEFSIGVNALDGARSWFAAPDLGSPPAPVRTVHSAA